MAGSTPIDNLRGAALMAGSMTAFTLNDAFMKGLSGDLPLAQAIFLRGLGASVLLLVLALAMGQLRFRLPRSDLGLLALRTATEVGAVYFFLTALFNMPLANATAILQALPLAVTLAGAVFLNEPLGWRRLVAILIGFLGVLLIVRPGMEGFTVYSLYVVVAVILVTARDLAVRRMSGALPSLTVALVTSLAVTLWFGIVAAAQPWVPVAPGATALLGGAMVCILAAYIFSVAAMRVGDLAVVAPFRYVAIVVALVVGYLAFGDWPDTVTLAGAALVVGSGLFTLWREQKRARSMARDRAGRPQAQASVDTPHDSH